MKPWFAMLALIVLTGAASAEGPPELGFPLRCTLDRDCWVVNYVDVDVQPESASDFQCGRQTYDQHKGTDFAIRDWRSMEAGVDVIAAAPGTVIRTRDGETDRVRTRDELAEIQKAGRECGNGVLVGHGGGWQTIYCHMKQGSIQVAKGETVQAGRKLGEVGHSGFVEFPHLHIGVTSNRQTIDPFTGLGPGAVCGKISQPLWRKDLGLGYQPVSIYAAGFLDAEPDFGNIQMDAAGLERMPAGVAAITFWVALFGVAKDDQIRLEIRDPQGVVVSDRDVVQERDRARQFYYVGRRLEAGELRPGVYTGIARISRRLSGAAPIEREASRELNVEAGN